MAEVASNEYDSNPEFKYLSSTELLALWLETLIWDENPSIERLPSSIIAELSMRDDFRPEFTEDIDRADKEFSIEDANLGTMPLEDRKNNLRPKIFARAREIFNKYK